MTDEQIIKFERETLNEKWPSRCKTKVICCKCGTRLETRYCEQRVYIVRCCECGKVSIVTASNPNAAAMYAGGRFDDD